MGGLIEIAEIHKLPRSVNARLDALILELRAANSIPELADIVDHAAELGRLVKKSRVSFLAQQQAAIIGIEAETRIGEILSKIERQPPCRPKNDSAGIVFPRLCDLGLTPSLAFRARRLAAIPRRVRDAMIQEALDTHRELTRSWLLQKCESYVQRQRNLQPQPGGHIDDLYALVASGRRFGTIYMDPPYEMPGHTLPYQTMTPEEIAALPVQELADPHRCHLHLWTLSGRYSEIAYRLAWHWGFSIVSDYVACRERMGRGNYYRESHDTLLLGRRADNDRDRFDDHSYRSGGVFPASDLHSAKPEEIRKMFETVSPPPRLELFARREIDGWFTWGHEVARPLRDQAAD